MNLLCFPLIAVLIVSYLIFPALIAPSETYAADATTLAGQKYPWSPVYPGTTGDYIADSYTGVSKGHVFESVTQERLLDILSSPGNYYIVLGGPGQDTSQLALPTINEQAKADGITKIYHFDPYIDGYQADITDSGTPYNTYTTSTDRTTNPAITTSTIHPISELWTSVTDLLPEGAPIASYDSDDTLLFLYNRNATTPGTHGTIRSYYSLTPAGLNGFNAATAKAAIANVFRGVGVTAPSSAQSLAPAATDDEQTAGADIAADSTEVSDIVSEDAGTADSEAPLATPESGAEADEPTLEPEAAEESDHAAKSDTEASESVESESASDSDESVIEEGANASASEVLAEAAATIAPSATVAPTVAVIPSTVRTDLQFFNRVYNASATRIEGSSPSANRIGAPVTLFDGLTETNFKLHQVNFAELQNIYNSPGEHVIFYGASWCHNTQAIIGSIAAKAAANANVKVVYVYDTTLGNQVGFGTGAAIDTAIVKSGFGSLFNSRNSYNNTHGYGDGNNNISYIYGEAVKPLGKFITENTSYQDNRIVYLPNGDLTGTATSVDPWAATDETNPDTISARRLQLPFLIAYDKSKSEPVIRQWLHAQQTSANAGKYLEYMLELAWVRATEPAKADTSIYSQGSGKQSDTNQTKVQIAAEAVALLDYVLDVAPTDDDNNNQNNNNNNNSNVNVYPVKEGTNASFGTYKGSGTASITIDADIKDFRSLYLNGALVDPSNYTLTEGSTVITLKEAYLKSLGAGTYIFTANFVDGVSEGLTLTIPESAAAVNTTAVGTTPKTGDDFGVELWTTAAALSVILLAALIGYQRRRTATAAAKK
ncbi:MAG: hypothetical protein LBQ21_05970 [Clostridiales Family XIII bacterium]|nr:hypothetical protein [Clostridiales Family XIII bacterium]